MWGQIPPPSKNKEYEKLEGAAENIINEKNVSECKKLQCLIQNVVKRNVTFIYHKEYDIIMIEYGNIVE